MNDRAILFCVHCRRWVSRRKVKRVPETLEVSALRIADDRCAETVGGEEIKIVQKGRAKRVYKNANLMLSHGRTVVIALAARGLGPDTAIADHPQASGK